MRPRFGGRWKLWGLRGGDVGLEFSCGSPLGAVQVLQEALELPQGGRGPGGAGPPHRAVKLLRVPPRHMTVGEWWSGWGDVPAGG